MQRITAFLGPAGSGKTYALVGEIERICSANSFQSAQCVLAITFMHGSRRRLTSRLHDCAKNGVSVQCETIDSFCLYIVNRYRRYLGKAKPVAIQHDSSTDSWSEQQREWKTSFRAIRKAAIDLLRLSAVRSAIGFAFPVIVVDEFQDCEDELLDIVRLLSEASAVLVAADEFQHLSESDSCPACRWLHDQNIEIRGLSGNRRTSDSLLHETAAALREGSTAASSIEVHAPNGPGLIAWHIASKLAPGKLPSVGLKALISPVRLSSSPWLQSILASLEKELGKKWKLRPRPFRWEGGEEELFESARQIVTAEIGPYDLVQKSMLRAFERSENPIVRMTGAQGRRLASIRGGDGLAVSEFLDILKQASHSATAFRRDRQSARIAMTVHGAKNREFDYVFIVWPFQVKDDDLFKRKLLYNAVTRAKIGAFLFVQGGEKRVLDDSVLSLLQCGLVQQKPKSSGRRSKAGQ